MKYPEPITRARLYRGQILLAPIIAFIPMVFAGRYAYLLDLFSLCGIYSLIVGGLTLLMGFAGQISLGHAAFYAMGAYCSAILSVRVGFPVWCSALIAIIITCVFSMLIGLPLMRLKSHYLALATLCVGVIVYEAINRSESLTGGANGIYNVPVLRVFGKDMSNPVLRFYFIWGLVILMTLWLCNLFESPIGRGLRAIESDESAARAFGVNVDRYKLSVFVASGILGALGGVLYAHLYSPSYLGPDEFNLLFSVKLVVMVVIGGLGSVWGGIAGAIILTTLHEVLSLIGESFHIVLIARIEPFLYGLILVSIMIFFPQGFIPGIKKRISCIWKIGET
ncbi:branched-chain amino acid ABC transporter permease [bacterium]|nr:branched-chain amino acid ABC transporter permease [bacterium]